MSRQKNEKSSSVAVLTIARQRGLNHVDPMDRVLDSELRSAPVKTCPAITADDAGNIHQIDSVLGKSKTTLNQCVFNFKSRKNIEIIESAGIFLEMKFLG